MRPAKHPAMKDLTIHQAIHEIENGGYRCEAGPLENNIAWRWLKERLDNPLPASGSSKAMPRYAAITISLDTERYRQNVRPDVKEHHVAYLINRLLSGESVALSEFEFLGMRVTIREALSGEILKK